MIETDPSRAPRRVREAVLRALRRGELPAAFLYDSPSQARRWLAYHQAWSPSRRADEVRALYRHAFRHAAGRMGRVGAVRLVGLGCGGGQKDADAAEALSSARGGDRAPLHYVAIDASATLADTAARAVAARVSGAHCHPLEADLSAAPPLREWMDTRTGPVSSLLTCFGMLPNQDAPRFAAYVASLMRAGDGLLISANLSPGGYETDRTRILEQYDNAEASAWYRGALADLGVPRAAAALEVTGERVSADGESWRIEVHAQARRDVTIRAYRESIPWRRGERLRLLHSNRFTERAARGLLAGAGLLVTAAWWDRTGEEGIFYASC